MCYGGLIGRAVNSTINKNDVSVKLTAQGAMGNNGTYNFAGLIGGYEIQAGNG